MHVTHAWLCNIGALAQWAAITLCSIAWYGWSMGKLSTCMVSVPYISYPTAVTSLKYMMFYLCLICQWISSPWTVTWRSQSTQSRSGSTTRPALKFTATIHANNLTHCNWRVAHLDESLNISMGSSPKCHTCTLHHMQMHHCSGFTWMYMALCLPGVGKGNSTGSHSLMTICVSLLFTLSSINQMSSVCLGTIRHGQRMSLEYKVRPKPQCAAKLNRAANHSKMLQRMLNFQDKNKNGDRPAECPILSAQDRFLHLPGTCQTQLRSTLHPYHHVIYQLYVQWHFLI